MQSDSFPSNIVIFRIFQFNKLRAYEDPNTGLIEK